jgi:hypothetical protein
MSLEKIEQYIRELEAMKLYDQVKAERDKLIARVKEEKGANSTLFSEYKTAFRHLGVNLCPDS